MIPLFKTHHSLKGRSILTLEETEEEVNKESPQSVFQICKDYGLKELFLVEDDMGGFLKAYKNATQEKIDLRFGLRINCVNDVNQKDNWPKSTHKVVLMAHNTDGIHSLIKISSKAALDCGGNVDCAMLKEFWNGLYLWIPYYDSFLFKNHLTLSTCIPDFGFTEPVFLKESNGVPLEILLDKALEAFPNNEKLEVKSIYYRNKADFLAWQTFKIMCDRGFSGNRSLQKPNLDHCCVDTFCIESWQENNKK